MGVLATTAATVAVDRLGTCRRPRSLGVMRVAFIQIIDFETDKMDEGRKHVDAYLAATEGRRTVQRSILCEDKDKPGHYLNIVFFDSYEGAMKNSAMPETGELAAQLGALTKGEQKFLNLEVVFEQS